MSKQKKQSDNSTKVAIITSLSSVVVVIISTILAPTVLKSLESRETPAPTPSQISTGSAPNSIIPTPDISLALFNLVNANSNSFYLTENASFDLINSNDGNILQITSDWYKSVYIDRELPENFTAYIRYELPDINTEFIIGLGDRRSWQYTYAISVTPYDISLDKRNTGENMFDRLFTTPQESKYKVIANHPIMAQFKRFNKSLTFLINGIKVFEVDRSMDTEINQYNYFFLSSYKEGQPSGTFTTDMLIITP